MWSTYSLYDPSYSNRESFGFFIDVGNGWTTLVPSLLFMWGVTFSLLEARMLGVVGLLMFYQVSEDTPTAQNILPQHCKHCTATQRHFIHLTLVSSLSQEFYGTVVYFLSYVFNGRYKGKPISEVRSSLLVCLSVLLCVLAITPCMLRAMF